MFQYEVALPEDLRLLVEVGDSPVRFSIRFHDGKEVKFSYIPWRTPRGRAEIDSPLDTKVISLDGSKSQRFKVSSPSARGQLIEFSDPEGTDM